MPFSLLKEYKDSDEVGKDAEQFESIHFAAKQLDAYRQMISSLRLMEILSRLIYQEQFGIFYPKLTEIDYQSALSILTTFMEKVRLTNPQTLTSLADQMKRLLDENIEYEISTDGDTNVVRIMNLRKTKGLEAKVVFLSGPTKPRPKGSYTAILTRNNWEEELEFPLYASWPASGEKVLYYRPPFYDKFTDEMRQDEAERLRELYVAATRAMEKLIITECQKSETWYELLTDDLTYLSIPEDSGLVFEEKYIAIDSIPSSDANVMKADQQSIAAFSSYMKVSPSDGSAFAKEASVDSAGIRTGLKVDTTARNAPFKGPLWGSLVHAGIECVLKDRESPVDDNLLNKAMTQGLSQYELTDVELFHLGNMTVTGALRHERLQQLQKNPLLKAALQQTLEQVMENDIFVELLADYDLFPELPFTAWVAAEAAAGLSLKQVGEAADKPVLVTGIIDLVLRSKTNKAEMIIIDYKTDRVEVGDQVENFRQRLLDAYQHQLWAYRSILGMMPVADREITVYLYAVTIDEFIPLEG